MFHSRLRNVIFNFIPNNVSNWKRIPKSALKKNCVHQRWRFKFVNITIDGARGHAWRRAMVLRGATYFNCVCGRMSRILSKRWRDALHCIPSVYSVSLKSGRGTSLLDQSNYRNYAALNMLWHTFMVIITNKTK